MCFIARLCLTLGNPTECSPPGYIPWGFSRQEQWRGLPYPALGDLSKPGIKLRSPALQVDSLLSEPQGSPNNKVGSLLLFMQQPLIHMLSFGVGTWVALV